MGLHLYPVKEMEHLKTQIAPFDKYSIFMKTTFDMGSCGDERGTNMRNVHTMAALLQTQPPYLQEKSFSFETCGFP